MEKTDANSGVLQDKKEKAVQMSPESIYNNPTFTLDLEPRDNSPVDSCSSDIFRGSISTLSPNPNKCSTVSIGSKRYQYQAKKVEAELYQLEQNEHGVNEWNQIRWHQDTDAEHENHTALLSFHALVQLRKCLAKGVLTLDLELDTQDFPTAFKYIAGEMAKKFRINEHKLSAIRIALNKSQKHLPELPGVKRIMKFWLGGGRQKSCKKEKTPVYETAQIFASSVDDLEKAKFAMVRLQDPLENLNNQHSPVRFIFVLLGPPCPELDYQELGRSMATLISNPSFQDLSYKAVDRQDLVFGMDCFLDEGVFIPPGNVLEQSITVGQIQQAIEKRRIARIPERNILTTERENGVQLFSEPPRDPLKRRKKLFGGLILDLKDRIPKYLTDFTDAFRFQIVSSILFTFFACFAPAITFGGLMGSYTEKSIGTIETLIAQSLSGFIWAFFSAQPLLLLSSTGPVLIFEAGLYSLCQQLELDFLTIRVWTGVWVLVISVVVVMFEGSALLRYVTTFAEEIFATLISLVFIIESLKFLYRTFQANPVKDLMQYWYNWELCNNHTNITAFDSDIWQYWSHWKVERRDLARFTYLDEQERHCFHHSQPDTFLLTTILLFATFAMAYLLKNVRSSYFLTRQTRRAIGDFGMIISIVVVALLEYVVFSGVFVQRLNMPINLDFTSSEKRGYSLFISWSLPVHQWWGYLFAIVPGFLVFILLFVETDVTQLLLIKKGRGLTKGTGGVHWDMILLGIVTLVCSIFGLPWMCATAAQSLAHVSSLTVMKPTGPGEKPIIVHVIEQRVTAIVVAVLLGVCALAGRFLRYIPLAVLFGVFLYLGYMGLTGMQFLHRLILFLVPAKYFPQVIYCQKVKPLKIHLFTFIQLLCVVTVYAFKSSKETALIFPLVLLLTCVLRHKVLPLMFNNDELNALDGEDEEDSEDEDVNDLFSALKF